MFHGSAAATGNARSPRLDRLVAGTNRVDVKPDRRRRHVSVSDVRCSVYGKATVVFDDYSGGSSTKDNTPQQKGKIVTVIK